MKRQQSTSRNWIYSWPEKSSRIPEQCYRLESFARITDIHMSGPVVKNHVSLKMVFGYTAMRKTTFQSWSQGYRRLLLRQARLEQHLQHHHRRTVQAYNPFQHELFVRVQTRKNGETCRPTQSKIRNPNRTRDHEREPGKPVLFRSTRMAARIERKSCGWKSHWAQRLTREFFSWTLFRAAETSGSGQSQCLHALPERPKLRDLPED